jgi:hypothetical protein
MKQSLEGLRRSAFLCRDLATSAITAEARDVLSQLADNYDQKATAEELAEAGFRRSASAFKWPLS